MNNKYIVCIYIYRNEKSQTFIFKVWTLEQEKWTIRFSYCLLQKGYLLFSFLVLSLFMLNKKNPHPTFQMLKNRTVIEFDLLGIYSQSIVGFYKYNPTMHLAYTSSLKVLTH